MKLRDYQQRSIDMLYEWMRNNDGNPCLQLPTGSGKSLVIAAICHDALANWPDTRILVLSHVKEILEQNAAALRRYWPGAPMGIYSASIGRRQLDEPITIAGIQSVRGKAARLGHLAMVIIDESHLVGHKDEGSYRTLLRDLTEINPALRVVGFTASPYRLGHGMITDKPAIFDALIEPVSIEELIYNGYLAPLRSKVTRTTLDTSGVLQRGGEFIESELQAAVDTDDNNQRVVDEVIALAGDRKAWLFFCAGIQHAQHIAAILRQRGIAADCVTGQTPKCERERMLRDFSSGRLRAITNANVLTTGFDYPDIDLIAMLRPTLSVSMFIQMSGRGMRPKSHTDHCLVLDFAGNVARHGPITSVEPSKRAGTGDGDAPVKVCSRCAELCHTAVAKCPACGMPFPLPEAKETALVLSSEDIMGIDTSTLAVESWRWRKHISRTSGKEMLACTYYGGLADDPITEYLPVLHDGAAAGWARNKLLRIAKQSGADLDHEELSGESLPELASVLTNATPPREVAFKRKGKFYDVIGRKWDARQISGT